MAGNALWTLGVKKLFIQTEKGHDSILIDANTYTQKTCGDVTSIFIPTERQ